ncbi:MAG: type I pantothenate kinase, partial [Actinomycetota bacterium]|nr:type I pantothenate kinase [Actinomycetota bacterium]
DADTDAVCQWFVQRFITLKDTAFTQPDAYFHRYADLSDEGAVAVATDIWTRINEVNLVENILPTRERASLILQKAADHSIERVRLRR